jgi:hypothetical protein
VGYTLLGKLVWRGGRWYLRRRYPNAGRRLKLAAAGLALSAGAAVAVASTRRSVPER